MTKTETNRIKEMLEYRRPARSHTEEGFITRYIDTIPGIYADAYGNRLLVRKGTPGSPRVMISCHTDSVHRMPGKQAVRVGRDGIVALGKRELLSNCLGADDCAGIYAALRMIEAGVQATFVFHRDEESGGRGSAWLAANYGDWLRTFDVCLALDRRGTRDVIVSQSYGKCASDEFVEGLARELGTGAGYRAADGIFTDSANYVGLIPECSNLSIGYYDEHSTRERLDLGYLGDVVERLIAVDWSRVPVVRKPGDSSTAWGADSDIDAEWCSECYQELTLANCTVLDAPDICDACWSKLTTDVPAWVLDRVQ